MAAVTKAYGLPIRNQYDGSATVDWNTHTMKIALLERTHTPSQDTHDFFNDVEADQIADQGGYAAGGATLTTPTVTYDSATDEIRLDADDVSWASPVTAGYAVVYRSTGTSSSSPLVCYLDFQTEESATSGNFAIVFDSTGVLKFDVS